MNPQEIITSHKTSHKKIKDVMNPNKRHTFWNSSHCTCDELFTLFFNSLHTYITITHTPRIPLKKRLKRGVYTGCDVWNVTNDPPKRKTTGIVTTKKDVKVALILEARDPRPLHTQCVVFLKRKRKMSRFMTCKIVKKANSIQSFPMQFLALSLIRETFFEVRS